MQRNRFYNSDLHDLEDKIPKPVQDRKVWLNDPKGEQGLISFDNAQKSSIRFCEASEWVTIKSMSLPDSYPELTASWRTYQCWLKRSINKSTCSDVKQTTFFLHHSMESEKTAVIEEE